jgi:hypothetical protein
MLAIGDNKRCSHCKTWKALSCFHHNKKRPDNHHDECKQCRNEYEQRPEVKKKISENKKEHARLKQVQRKRCTGCEKWKPWAEFSRRAKSVDGLCYRCKQCQSEYHKKCQSGYRRTVTKVKAWTNKAPEDMPDMPVAKYNITSRESRRKLVTGDTIYWQHVKLGKLCLGYIRRNPWKPGIWVMRIHLGTTITGRASPYVKRNLGLADDFDDDNDCLNFIQAKAIALARYAARIEPMGGDDKAPLPHDEPIGDEISPKQEAAIRRRVRRRVLQEVFGIEI